METSPAIHLWTVRLTSDVATTLPLEVFTQRNHVANCFREKLNFTGKNSKIAFCATLWGTTYMVHLWLVGKRVVDFLLVLIELFRQLSWWRRCGGYWLKSWCSTGGGSIWAQISGGRGSSTDIWCQKTRVPALSRGAVCVIVGLAVLIQYRRVTDRQTQTNRQTHDDG